MNTKNINYPIGRFKLPSIIDNNQINLWISTLENFPDRIENLVATLTQEQIDTPYRTDGWTVRQLVHHLYDSHHNSYTRFKWALTEKSPLIKGFDERAWADLFDSKNGPIELSIHAIIALHAKWVYLLKGLNLADLQQSFVNPDENKTITLAENIGFYAWHCNHHFAKINNLLQEKGWN